MAKPGKSDPVEPQVCVLTVRVVYDQTVTDPESLATALDRLLETALSTPGIMDDYGPAHIDEFIPQDAEKK